MNTEFHFYITGLIAHAAGFNRDEAKTIATASEFVDENDMFFTIEDREGGEPYEVYISQTMNILKPKRKLMRIYPIFHFVPGDPLCDSACRGDGKMHRLNTTPDNENANTLMDAAWKAPEDIRLHRVGVATHAYTDTWAHQNFVGWFDYFNNIGLDPKPDIGHADAEHHPDWVSHRWEDTRLVEGMVDNNERFLAGGEALYGKYRSFLTGWKRGANLSWRKLRVNLLDAMGPSRSGSENWGREKRLENYKALAPWLGEFDEDEWFEAAFETDVRGLPDRRFGLASTFSLMKDRYFWREDVEKEDTDWFRFQEAVKAHQREALELLRPTFDKMGVDLHQH